MLYSTNTIFMADEMQRLIDASNKADDISKCDRLLRVLPMCLALARHPNNLELMVAGGRNSLASTIFRVIVYAMPPTVCCSLSEASPGLKSCTTLLEEIHTLTEALPSAITLLRRVLNRSPLASCNTCAAA
jgi:hypothetical protein